LREPPPQAGEVPRLRVADDLQLDTGRCKAGDPGVEEALEAFALGQPVEASDDDRASRRVGSDGTMRNPRTIVARRQESDLARLGGRCERLAVLGGVGSDEVGLGKQPALEGGGFRPIEQFHQPPQAMGGVGNAARRRCLAIVSQIDERWPT
jgi:hypothetical protein